MVKAIGQKNLSVQHAVDALLHPRSSRTLLILLCAFVVVWTLVAAVVHFALDINSDVGEALRWWHDSMGRKHPPMSGWITGIWFSVFPQADWASYLLAAVLSALSLLIAWHVLGDWLDAEKRIVGMAMLSLIPLYTFLASKPNANTVMMPFWAATTLFFLRAVTRQSIPYAVLAGAALAGAMLSKYWTIYLAAGLAAVTLMQGRRLVSERAIPPFTSGMVALALVLPHLWILIEDPASIAYVRGAADTEVLGSPLLRSARYLGGLVAYVGFPLLLFAILAPSRAALRDTFLPQDPNRRMIAVLLLVPLVLPALVNIFWSHRLTALWSYPNWTLLPVFLLGSDLVTVTPLARRRIVTFALLFPLLALMASPVASSWEFGKHVRDTTAFHRQTADFIWERWRNATTKPLSMLGGEVGLVHGASFYLPDRIDLLQERGLLDADIRQRLLVNGGAVVCRTRVAECMKTLQAFEDAIGGTTHETTLSRRWFGIVAQDSFSVLVMPPEHGP